MTYPNEMSYLLNVSGSLHVMVNKLIRSANPSILILSLKLLQYILLSSQKVEFSEDHIQKIVAATNDLLSTFQLTPTVVSTQISALQVV
jgi:hypothetical protein